MTAEKYLPPGSDSPGRAARLAAKFIVQVSSPAALQPVSRVLRRVFRAPQVQPRRPQKRSDWHVYAQDRRKYFVKKYQARICRLSVLQPLVMDLKSMDWNGPAEARKAGVKVDWSRARCRRRDAHEVRLRRVPRRALGYLMIHQQDPVGLVAFDTKPAPSCRPKASGCNWVRSSRCSRTSPTEGTNIRRASVPARVDDHGKSLAGFQRPPAHNRRLALEVDASSAALPPALQRHEVIVFHILDVLEAKFPLTGLVGLRGRGVAGAQGDRRAGHSRRLRRVRRAVPRLHQDRMHWPRTSITSAWTRPSVFDSAL